MLTIYGDLISDEYGKIYGVGFDEYIYMLKTKGKKTQCVFNIFNIKYTA